MDCPEFRRHHLAYVDDTLPGDVLVAAERHRVECAACGAHDTLVRRSLLIARNLPTIEPSADFAARLEARLREARVDGRPTQAAARWSDAGWSEAPWYERLAQDAGGWGRQAVAAAVVLAAVSAGYAIRGGREAAPGAPAPNVSAAPAFGGPVFGARAFGAETLGTTEVAAAPGGPRRAGRVGRAVRPTRARAADAAAGGGMYAREADDLGAPAYIPLPAGVLEASALLGPASAGIPVWPAALLAGEAPTQLRSAAPGAPSVRLVGLSH